MLLQILAGIERGVSGFPPYIILVFLMVRKATENSGIPQRPNVQEQATGFSSQMLLTLVLKASKIFRLACLNTGLGLELQLPPQKQKRASSDGLSV